MLYGVVLDRVCIVILARFFLAGNLAGSAGNVREAFLRYSPFGPWLWWRGDRALSRVFVRPFLSWPILARLSGIVSSRQLRVLILTLLT